ncbi:MAG: NAD-binding protein [Oscillospiraceae bacterium]
MNITVIGGGKVGYYLTKTLLEHGHIPTLIEISKETCEFVANDLDIPIICGDGTSIDTLETANAQNADAFISVTGQDQNNLISCQLAKKLYNVKKTIAKVNNPKNAEVMKKLGIDITISSTDNIARLLEREVDTSAIKELISFNQGEASLNEIVIPKNFKPNSQKLSDLKLPKMCVVATISRNGEMIIPRGDTQIQCGDTVMIIAKNEVMHQVKLLLKLEDEAK